MIASFFDKARTSVGASDVLTEASDVEPYTRGTGERKRKIAGVVRVSSTEEVRELVMAAGKFRVSLYPISTGKNWGYGTAQPVVDDSVILDLSCMNRIIECDRDLGIVTLEPGVTQRQLYEYLQKHQLPYLVPTTGAGPTASIVGNILERGYGLAPYTDHFSAVTSLEVVLPDGSLYQPALAALGAMKTERVFKYGLGPYLDGIFTQSNFGVITQVTILLKRRPERSDLCVFWVKESQGIESAVRAIRDIMTRYESIVPTVKLVSQLRSFATSNPYPKTMVTSGGSLDPQAVSKIAQRALVTPWVGIGVIAGDPGVVKVARGGIRSILRRSHIRTSFFGPSLLRFILFFLNRSPFKKLPFASSFSRAANVLAMFNGEPNFIEHHIDYWKSGKPFPKGTDPDPARDGTGLFWYSPLVPMKPLCVRQCVEQIEKICRAHGLDPLITASAMSGNCFDVTTYLLFDAQNSEECERAHECYEELYREGQKQGYLPYRLNIDFMDLPEKFAPNVWHLVNKIKRAIDPKGIIAPGRYSSIKVTRHEKSDVDQGLDA